LEILSRSAVKRRYGITEGELRLLISSGLVTEKRGLNGKTYEFDSDEVESAIKSSGMTQDAVRDVQPDEAYEPTGLDIVTTPNESGDVSIDWAALSEGVREQYVDWLPFLVFGMPYADVARLFRVHKSTITKALSSDKSLARAVAIGRTLVKRQLHYMWLDQKAVAAWRNIGGTLEVDPYEKDSGGSFVYDQKERIELLKERNKMSRFVVQQLGLNVQRVEVTHNTPMPMFLGDSSMADLVVSRVLGAMDADPKSRDPEAIAAEYRVVGGDYGETVDISYSEEEEELAPVYVEKNPPSKFKDEY